MKKLKLFWATMILISLILSSKTLNAASVISLEIAPIHHEKMFVLSLKAKGSGMIKIEILDQKQDIIFSQELESILTFEKKYNLELMKKGEYILQIEDELKVTSHSLKLGLDKIEVNNQLIKSFRKPFVKISKVENRVDINWMMSQRGTYRLAVKNKDEYILFEDVAKNEIAIHKSYDISKLKKGKYVFIIENEKRKYFKAIEIE
ncbi:MAG: hypothetical protein AB8H03_20900 [Saprospiraceae bacterium]